MLTSGFLSLLAHLLQCLLVKWLAPGLEVGDPPLMLCNCARVGLWLVLFPGDVDRKILGRTGGVAGQGARHAAAVVGVAIAGRERHCGAASFQHILDLPR